MFSIQQPQLEKIEELQYKVDNLELNEEESLGHHTNFLASHTSAFEGPTTRVVHPPDEVTKKPVFVESQYVDGEPSRRIETMRGSKLMEHSST